MGSRNRKGAGWRAMLYLLIGVCLVGIGYSGYRIYDIQAEYAKGDDLYAEIRREIAAQPAATGAASTPEALEGAAEPTSAGASSAPEDPKGAPQPTPTAAAAQTGALSAPEDPKGTPQPTPTAAAAQTGISGAPKALEGAAKPTPAGTSGAPADVKDAPQPTPTAAAAQTGGQATEDARPASQMDFPKLKEMNGDTVAWITLDGSVIDYPVVQGEDNTFYLNHLYNGRYGIAGSIFMDMANAPDFSDQNTILFGHHMNNGSMFAGLDKYRSQKYYDEHPSMTLYTPQGDYRVEWFSAHAIKAAPLPIHFEDGDFMKFVEDAIRKSNFKSDVEISPTDRIVTLCTCSYVSDDARYILMGVLR